VKAESATLANDANGLPKDMLAISRTRRMGSGNFRQRLTGASMVLIATTAMISLLRIVNSAVLTRLLAPSDFGLIGIVLSIFFVIGMITDAGFQAFIVRHARGLDPQFLDAVWTVHISRAICNCIIAASLSYPLAILLSKPQLAPLMIVASLTLAIDGTASLTLMTSLRQGLVRRLSLVDFCAFVVQFMAGIGAAWLFRSVWAIIISMFMYSLSRVLASYLIFPDSRRRFRFDREIFSELWRFSRVIAASSVLTLVISQVDKLLFARIFVLRQFGVYIVAANLAAAPVGLAMMYTSRIIYPSVSEIWRSAPDNLRQHFYELRGILFYGYLVGAGALGGGAPLVVGLLYDSRYQGASAYLRLLAITTAMTMMGRPANEMLVASGRVRTTLQTNIVRVIWLAVAMPIGLVWLGPIGAVGALALVELPAYVYGAAKLVAYKLYSPRHELLGFAAILGGAVIGLIAASVVPASLWKY
jgi:lipopolysaccharide exporter